MPENNGEDMSDSEGELSKIDFAGNMNKHLQLKTFLFPLLFSGLFDHIYLFTITLYKYLNNSEIYFTNSFFCHRCNNEK